MELGHSEFGKHQKKPKKANRNMASRVDAEVGGEWNAFSCEEGILFPQAFDRHCHVGMRLKGIADQ